MPSASSSIEGKAATNVLPETQIPTCSEVPYLMLRPGSRFVGTQRSDSHAYAVEVVIQGVDMSRGFLCGDLQISGLTAHYPTLTTYFDAEVVTSTAGFLTRNWGAKLITDMQHWEQFDGFQKYGSHIKSGKPPIPVDPSDSCMFMRWKERFLVPDHRVTSIRGASIAGFYYIHYDKHSHDISGFYYHCSSERFQRLSLSLVQDEGSGSYQFA